MARIEFWVAHRLSSAPFKFINDDLSAEMKTSKSSFNKESVLKKTGLIPYSPSISAKLFIMKKLLLSTMTIALLLFSTLSFSQKLNLGILTSFEGYTGDGGVSNGADAVWTGDVGSNNGIISGAYDGDTYNADEVTDQARKDLLRIYIHLNDIFVNFPGTHAPAFGGGETITPGVYSIGGAGSIGGNLTLAGGENDFFIIKFNGALTVGAGAVVTLTGGIKSSNVIWIANGAISVAANANLKGTLFSKAGAIGIGVGVVLEGRMLTLAGAITTGVGAIASLPIGISTIPIYCDDGCIPAPAVDVLGVVSDFALFTSFGAVANTGISGMIGKIGTNGGAISGYTSGIHIGTEHNADTLTAQAKIDLDNAYTKLMALTVTGEHAAAFGAGETLLPGVYDMAAGSLAGTITLDGLGDPDAIFVTRFAGAFNVAAQSKVILVNGAKRCNVFWLGGAGVTTGAVNIGASAHVKGNFLSHGGASNSGASVFLGGRQLSTNGAVNTNAGIVYTKPECVNSRSLSAQFDHLQIEHDGEGSTCAAEIVTVKACADEACDILVESGDITTTVEPFGSTINIGVSGSQTLSVTPSTAGTSTLFATDISPAPTNITTACLNTTTNAADCDLLVSACANGGFECLQSDTNSPWDATARKPLFTKLVGSEFSFDVVALKEDGNIEEHYVAINATPKSVIIELVDGSGVTSCANRSVTNPDVSQTLSFAGTDVGRKNAVMTVTKAYTDLRCRVTDTNTNQTACSTDNFSVRPSAITMSSTANAAAPSATDTTVIKAGENFSLWANTTNTDGYEGLLYQDTSKLTAQNTVQATSKESGGVVGTLSPALLVADGASMNATYDEVGYLYLAAGAYRDEFFTLVDSTSGDCVTDTSNDNNLADTLVEGQYGCDIGNKTAVSLGRFIPDHFETTLTHGCSTFTYSGQPFNSFNISAYKVSGTGSAGLTQNYAGAYAKALTLSDMNAVPNEDSNGSLSSTNIDEGAFIAGVYSNSTLSYAFSPITHEPATIQLRAAETSGDGVTSSEPMQGETIIRGGRMRILNAFGSELLDLPMTLRSEYWENVANGWQPNTADTCTDATLSFSAVSTPDITHKTCVQDTGAASGNSGEGCSEAASTTKQYKEAGVSNFAGDFNLWLKASGADNTGSIYVTPTVPLWLQYNWTGVVANPKGLVTFGVYKSGADKVIHRQEMY